MSYNFSISGNTEGEMDEWNMITGLANVVQNSKEVTSAVGNTQYHGVVDLFKVQTGAAINPPEGAVPEPQTKVEPVVITDSKFNPATSEGVLNMPAADDEVTSMSPETGTEVTVQAVDKSVRPVFSHTGEIVGYEAALPPQNDAFTTGNTGATPTFDAEHEVTGWNENVAAPKEQEQS